MQGNLSLTEHPSGVGGRKFFSSWTGFPFNAAPCCIKDRSSRLQKFSARDRFSFYPFSALSRMLRRNMRVEIYLYSRAKPGGGWIFFRDINIYEICFDTGRIIYASKFQICARTFCAAESPPQLPPRNIQINFFSWINAARKKSRQFRWKALPSLSLLRAWNWMLRSSIAADSADFFPLGLCSFIS